MYYLYVARLLSGIVGGAIAVGVPTLICDISHDKLVFYNKLKIRKNSKFKSKLINKPLINLFERSVRGALNALYDLSFNVGTIISFFLGTHLSCIDQAIAQLAVPAIFMILMFFVPESPEYWTNRNKQKVRLNMKCANFKCKFIFHLIWFAASHPITQILQRQHCRGKCWVFNKGFWWTKWKKLENHWWRQWSKFKIIH